MMRKGDVIKADVKTKIYWGGIMTLIGSARIELITETTGRIKKGIDVYGRSVWLEDGVWFCESELTHRPMPKGKAFTDMIEWGLRDH